MPFKPLGHPHPSGDLIIGSGLYDYLRECGHDIRLVSRLRARWIYWKPWQWARLPIEIARTRRMLSGFNPHVWLTYHSYYKAPDLLGAICAPSLGIPYAIFQGVYSTKRRRQMKTKPGFYLNRWVLQQADTIFTNKLRDEINLRRLVSASRLHYIAPGMELDRFIAAHNSPFSLRGKWTADGHPVILTAAMFRPGVKAEGIAQVIRSCGRIADQGHRFKLVICGDGTQKACLTKLARECLGTNVHFAGRIPHGQMPHYYQKADIFVFPGIEEGLGMVYVESQAAGLPVVACRGWGASEVVRHKRTGLLSTPGDWKQFEGHIVKLLLDEDLRRSLGQNARQHVRNYHDINLNYRRIEHQLQQLAAKRANH